MKKGFSLIELLIYTGLFAVAAGLLTGITLTVTRVQTQESAGLEVTRQSQFIMQRIQNLVRESSLVEDGCEGKISSFSPLPSCPSSQCAGDFCFLKLRTEVSGADPTYIYIPSETDGVYLKQGNSEAVALTTDKVKVGMLKFSKIMNPGGHSIVNVDLTLNYNSTNPILSGASKRLTSAVSRVSAATFDSNLLPNANNTLNIGAAGTTWKNILMADGTAASPAYSFGLSSTTGMFSPGAGIIGFSTGGSERMRIGDSFSRFYQTGEKTISVAFVNGVANQKVDIYFNLPPATAVFWGNIEVEVTSTYNNQNSPGSLKKVFSIGLNAQGGSGPYTPAMFDNTSYYTDATGVVADNWAIKGFSHDATNGRYYFTVIHRVSTGNTVWIKIRGFGSNTTNADNISSLTATAVYTTDATVYYKPVVESRSLRIGYTNGQNIDQTDLSAVFNGNVGIGTISPGSALDVKGTLRLSGSTSGYVGLAPAAAAGSITYTLPSADGTSGQVLSTSGSGVLGWATYVSGSTPTGVTVVTRPVMATGAVSDVSLASLTVYKTALFQVPSQITVNQLAYNVGVVTTAGSYRICVYNEAGTTKLIDVTDVPTAGVNTAAVAGAVLNPGNYYVAMGCATTCSNTISMFTSTAATWINTSAVPTGKKVYEGTVTMTSGTCNATLPTIAGAISSAPVMRLDN